MQDERHKRKEGNKLELGMREVQGKSGEEETE